MDKAQLLSYTKVNLGSSTRCLDGFLNLDWPPSNYAGFNKVERLSDKCVLRTPDAFLDISNLSMFPDNHFEYVRASHVLEHFPQTKTHRTLKEWTRVLRPGGILDIVVPDISFIMKKFFEEPDNSKWWEVQKNDLGLYCDSELHRPFEIKDQAMVHLIFLNGHHTQAFTPRLLEWYMNKVGVTDCFPYVNDIPDTAVCDYSIWMKGFKGGKQELKICEPPGCTQVF